MTPLTVAILAKDEHDRIGAAIASVGWAAEVLVLDSGSVDDTVGVAQAAGARVERTDWPGFAAQRGRAQALATHPWVLFLDADETVDPTLAAALQRFEPGDACAFEVTRVNHWHGRPVRGGTFGPHRVTRLVRLGGGSWQGAVHETWVPQGPVGALQGTLLHTPYRSIGEHLDTVHRYAALWAESASARPSLLHLVVRPPLHFVKAFLLKGGFRDGVRGLLLAWIGAVYVALKWGLLWLDRPQSTP